MNFETESSLHQLLNFEQQLTSERQFLEQNYGSTPWCELTVVLFTIGNWNAEVLGK